MKGLYGIVFMLCFVASACWAEELTMIDEPLHSQRDSRKELLQAKANVQYAEERLQEAQESLNTLREQRPVVAGNNQMLVESQLETYQLAFQAREEAVRVARANLKEAQLELQELEQGRGGRHHRRSKAAVEVISK